MLTCNHMKKIIFTTLAAICLLAATPKQTGWISLFDGKTLNGWKVGENAETFTVDSGCIIAHGKTAHLFYEGDVHNHTFKDFDFKADVMTRPGSNSGIYIHTQYQEGG